MAERLQAIRGMNDILPDATPNWQQVETVLRQLMCQYDYHEIRFPIVEPTKLYVRGVGEATDIVEKEMYTFDDRNGDSLTLRPEGTAGCIRAALQHGLTHNQQQRLWYYGPMFRHERPQKGRYRQFTQLGVEAIGMAGPDIDIELIAMTDALWRQLGMRKHVRLELNSLGTAESRQAYRQQLVAYLEQHYDQLDQDSQRRLTTNPLRILDSKNPQMRDLIEQAPQLQASLDDESLAHFEQLKQGLDALGIEYVVNPQLVRGLDYYGKTVFEWVTDALGAQGTVCAGGRYDALIPLLGGKPTPAVGFAMGVERLLLLLETLGLLRPATAVDIIGLSLGQDARQAMQVLVQQLRQVFPQKQIRLYCGEGGLKAQFKQADRCGAQLALIMAEDELTKGVVSVKNLQQHGEQQQVSLTEIQQWLEDKDHG